MSPEIEFEIRPVTELDELEELHAIQRSVWRMEKDTQIVPSSLLLPFSKHGGLVLGAFRGDKMVGCHFSFLARTLEGQLFQWSHITGVLPDFQHSGLGETIKWAQHDAVLASGLDLVRWTVDPLEGVNNAVNFGKLGVTSHVYERNVYGQMDGINAGVASDRLTVDWQLDSERVRQRRARGRPDISIEQLESEGVERANQTEALAGGLRRVVAVDLGLAPARVLVEVPGNFQLVKGASMKEAAAWRTNTRAAFETYFGNGYVATEFVSEGSSDERRNYYLLERPD